MVRKWHTPSYSTVVVLGVLLCVCSALGGFATVEGQTPVWSDNFNDGTYAPEWTVQEGSFSVTNNQLECGPDLWNWIHHPSTVATGEWRFDVFCGAPAGARVNFMALDTSGVGTSRPEDGYFIQFAPTDPSIRLYRNVDGSPSWMAGIPDNPLNQLVQVIVTRNSSGYFNVWINGEHRMEAESTHHTTSTYFLVLINGISGYIDNIEVYDEILTHTDGTDGTDGT
ncbi:MAG: hypothetical protein ACFE8F_09050, partial [Promethearchaeota archaeon]